jgi:hypothetical protein
VRGRLVVAGAAACVLAAAAAAAGRGEAAKTCVPSAVHYRDAPGAHAIGFRGGNPPWVEGDGVIGFLFYYGVAPFGRMHSARAYVTTGGKVGAGANTKILWWFRRTPPVGGSVTVTGRRLDAAGSFRDVWRTRVGTSFPSYLIVPAPGCWRVAVSSGAAHASFIFGAFRD